MNSTLNFAYFAGGCFWCTEAIYLKIRGVVSVLPGYAGGHLANPTYEQVCSGDSGHTELIKIEYDSKEIDYLSLVDIFFNTHDPTTLNRQGNDVGTQYRSAVFCINKDEKRIVINFIKSLHNSDKIVTEVNLLDVFYPAEDYHKNYYNMNKRAPYCSAIIAPKISKFMSGYKESLK
ncbi:MAG: peptide-methionine (S)-S-oxide reductase MsrA [Flavobacteriaceae bacterium]